MTKTKVVVAYSGGLDTSVMIKWLIEKKDAEVIAVTGDLGQRKELGGIQTKAYTMGASKVMVQDLREEFLRGYCWPALKAGAVYERSYYLSAALGRPLLAKMLVDIAHKEGATHVAHGCTGKGNDQVRFEVSIGALDPDVKILAPVREWEFKSREEEIRYARKHDIPISVTLAKPYSIDENLWGSSTECGSLEDPAVEPPEDAYSLTRDPRGAPDAPEYVDIEFQAGVPVRLDGNYLEPISLVFTLNHIGGAHGIGRSDLVENRLVGIKSREIYEAPAATILHFAHQELERLTLTRDVLHLKQQLAEEYARLVYDGLWYSPLRTALDAFVNDTQQNCTGTVRVKLYKGSCTVVGRKSVFSLYSSTLATYTESDSFDHKAAAGFIKIFGLPIRLYNQVNQFGHQHKG